MEHLGVQVLWQKTLSSSSSPFPDQIISNLLLLLMNFEIQNGTFIVKFSVRSISVGIAVMKFRNESGA